jgi:hypothetical protein
MVEISVELVEQGLLALEVRLLLRVAVVAAASAEVVRAAVVASLVPQVSHPLEVVVSAAKVDLPVSPAPQASRLVVVQNRSTN